MSLLKTSLFVASLPAVFAGSLAPRAGPVASIECNGQSYSYEEFAGYGSVSSNQVDIFGESISIGSSLVVADWKKEGDSYTGTLYGLPDRGWNTNGTQNTQPRLHILSLTFTPAPDATVANPSSPNVDIQYKTSILLTSPDGTPMSGLDPDQSGGLKYPGFPVLPAATYPGDGFGGGDQTQINKRVVIDAEGLFLGENGSFWISDEYGPFVYQFDSEGRLISAIQPPDALLPLRQGEVGFSSNNPPIYDLDRAPVPPNPTQGRQNNQGFEGLTISPDGKYLYVLLQSAARQEGGSSPPTRRNVRFLKYALSHTKKSAKCRPAEMATKAEYLAEWVVPLPTFKNPDGTTAVAAQSEVHYISDTQFIFLPRDAGFGRGYKDPTSIYRHIDVFDISKATDIKDTYDAFNSSITTGTTSDTLKSDVTPAVVCPFINFNINDQLQRFTAVNGDAIHNGAPVNRGLLNEKWESLAILPANEVEDGRDINDEYYVLTLSDNDFITDKGFMNFGKFPFTDHSLPDSSVTFLDNQALMFKITLPAGSKPLLG